MEASENRLGHRGMTLKEIMAPQSLPSWSPLLCSLVAMYNDEMSSFISPCMSTIMSCLAKDPKYGRPAGHVLSPLILWAQTSISPLQLIFWLLYCINNKLTITASIQNFKIKPFPELELVLRFQWGARLSPVPLTREQLSLSQCAASGRMHIEWWWKTQTCLIKITLTSQEEFISPGNF